MPDTPHIDFQELQEQARLSGGAGAPPEPGRIEGPYDVLAARAERAQAHNKGITEYYKLRQWWSHCLMGLLVVLVLFQCCLVLAVGRAWMDFSRYQAFLKLQAGVYFVQIVSLCVIVVKYLFSPPRDPEL